MNQKGLKCQLKSGLINTYNHSRNISFWIERLKLSHSTTSTFQMLGGYLTSVTWALFLLFPCIVKKVCYLQTKSSHQTHILMMKEVCDGMWFHLQLLLWVMASALFKDENSSKVVHCFELAGFLHHNILFGKHQELKFSQMTNLFCVANIMKTPGHAD